MLLSSPAHPASLVMPVEGAAPRRMGTVPLLVNSYSSVSSPSRRVCNSIRYL